MNAIRITELNPVQRRLGDSVSFSVNGVPFTFTFVDKPLNELADNEINYQFSNSVGPAIRDYFAVAHQVILRVHDNIRYRELSNNRYVIESYNGDVFSDVSTNTSRISIEVVESSFDLGESYVNPNDVLIFKSERGTDFTGGFSLKINEVAFGFEFVDSESFDVSSFQIPFSFLSRVDKGVSSAVHALIMNSNVLEYYGTISMVSRGFTDGDRLISPFVDRPFEVTDIKIFGNPPLNIYAVKPNGDILNAEVLAEPVGFLGREPGVTPVDDPVVVPEQQNTKYRIFGGYSGPSIGVNVRREISFNDAFVASSNSITASSLDRVAGEN